MPQPWWNWPCKARHWLSWLCNTGHSTLHGFSISTSPKIQWLLESCQFCPQMALRTGSSSLLLFWLSLFFCPDCWDSFLTSFPISGPAPWPACPPLCHGLLSLNHRHDVFPQVSLALERVYTPKHSLQGVYDQMDLSSCPLPSPNLMFILYSWHWDSLAVSWTGHTYSFKGVPWAYKDLSLCHHAPSAPLLHLSLPHVHPPGWLSLSLKV